jgi:predicted acyl esterase
MAFFGSALVRSGTFTVALLLAACSDSGSSTAGGNDGGGSQATPPTMPDPTYPSTVSEELAITMADGVRLGATITFPSEDGETRAPGQFPVLVSVTPYGRNLLSSAPDRATFATRGIIGVTVDTRGTGGSEGNLNENYFSPLEASDSATVIEYVATQDYANGKVGMAGGSYVGITQLLAAAQQPPHLRVIAPQVVTSDLYRDGYAHGGIPNLFFDVQYLVVQGGPGYGGINTDPELLPMTVAGKIQQLLGTPIALDYLARPNDDDFYRDRSPIYVADRIKVPVLLIGGWRDGLSQHGAPELYRVLAQRPDVETRLYMDPCTHKGCGAPFAPLTNPPGRDDLNALIFEFLAKYLLDTPTPQRPKVRVYVQQAEQYLDDTQWPPRGTRVERLYLSQATLSTDAPAQAATQSYFTNPLAGLSMSFDFYGTVGITPYLPTDQRLESVQGLTWRSAALEQPLTLMGPSALRLIAASTATDTDWIVKLSDVAPGGSESIITNGYLRASHRELDTARSRPLVPYHTHLNPTPINAGENHVYDIEIWPTAYQLKAGHQLQLRLTSYDLPTHAPASISLDLGNPLQTRLTPMLPAINTVTEGGSDASVLELSVYPN